MDKVIKLFTGEVLRLNRNGVWEIFDNENSKVGYPVDLIEVIINMNKMMKK